MNFCIETWQERLAAALRLLETAQRPYLEGHWQASGHPATLTYNGQDETPYPRDDLLQLYDTALLARKREEVVYFAKLRTAFDPVRGVLRSNPALGRALGSGPIDFRLGACFTVRKLSGEHV